MARAAAAAGTIMCLSTIATATPAEVAAAAPDAPRWFQLYVFRDRGVTRSFVEQAVEPRLRRDRAHGRRSPARAPRARPAHRVPHPRGRSSCRAWPPMAGGWEGATPLELLGAIDPSLTWDDLAELRALVAAPARAEGDPDRRGRAARMSSTAPTRSSSRTTAAASSTPSRRPPTLLPEIVEAVDGRIEVYVDGGIRRGSDVVKALALGARAVLAGRAPLWGLASDGEAGARRVLELLRRRDRARARALRLHVARRVSATHLSRIVGP